nr:LOW QUALITY PROTEIN: fumarylacetoacetase-like [Nerophis lumbriciformis]
MTMTVNETHQPSLRSWVQSANQAGTDFPIQNLPFGVFPHPDDITPAGGVAIGDQVLDLRRAHQLGLLEAAPEDALHATTLNPLMALGATTASALRAELSELLREGSPATEAAAQALRPMGEVELLLPAEIGDYTDFYCSVHHANNVGSMFRPDNPLMPNYKHLPVGYHGRASSIVPSGTAVRRPSGQSKAPDAAAPSFGPSKLLDYELEVGFYVGRGNEMGTPVGIERAEQHLFGFCLVNDWSARDIQAWEYQPLGPFLGKSFATTVSPWVVTTEALAPFRVAELARAEGDPRPLPHLRSAENSRGGGIDLQLEVYLSTERMRGEGAEPTRLSRGNYCHLYWTTAQMLAHHASNGCNLRPGDLMASGTVSGPDKSSRGCLLELTWRGAEPITLPNGEARKFLADGDQLTLRGFCDNEGATRIGFGECSGVVLPALT